MNKILIINGHPSKDGLSFFISKNYLNGAKEAGAEVKTITLSDLKFDASYKGYSDKKPLERDLLNAQKAISWANFVVFIYPTWWGAMPGLLKSFVDKVFAPGYAFKYSPKGKLIKLLAGKSGRIITTVGSPKLYVLANHALLTDSLKYPVLKFCGFGSVRTTVFHTIRRNMPEERLQKIAIKSLKLGKKDAVCKERTFSHIFFHRKF